MTVQKTLTGMIVISDVVRGYLMTVKFIGYSKKEAIQRFKKGAAKKFKSNVSKDYLYAK
jgi:hypothetical protein